MEEIRVGKVFQNYLIENGYDCILATFPNEAMTVMNNGMRIDFVVSAALRWKEQYEFAFAKYGSSNVIIFTGTPELASEIAARGVFVFEKPVSFAKVVDHIKKVCPPN